MKCPNCKFDIPSETESCPYCKINLIIPAGRTGVSRPAVSQELKPDPEELPKAAESEPFSRSEIAPSSSLLKWARVLVGLGIFAVIGHKIILTRQEPKPLPPPAPSPPVVASPAPPAQPLPAPALPAPSPAPTAAPAAPPAVPEAKETWDFDGRVYDLMSLRPVYGADLVFSCQAGEVRASSDEQGHYAVRLPALTQGFCHLSIEHPNYQSFYLDEIEPPYRSLGVGLRKALRRGRQRNLPWVGKQGEQTRRDLVLIPQ